jgi:hypothetical protein
MSFLTRYSLLALPLLGACSEHSPSVLEPNEPSMAVGTYLYSPSRNVLAGVVFSAQLDSRGALAKAPVGMVFNLNSASSAATFFQGIAGRTAATARNGQFYAPPATDPSYENTKKILSKLQSLAVLDTAFTARGVAVKVARVSPSSWWSATAGKPPATASTFGFGATPGAKNARLLYRDSQGRVYTAYFTFAYTTTAVASASGASDASERRAIPWHDRLTGQVASLRTSPRFTRTAVAHAQVAVGEAVAADGEFKVVNGNAAGKGKRWSGTCVPGADYASGSYDVLSEIPGTNAKAVGGLGATSYASVLYDGDVAYCSL